MHATLKLSQSITRVIQYHELKISRSQAELIGGDNFVKDAQELSLAEKLYYFNQRIMLNEEVWKPVLHPVLRFNRGEEISNSTMQRVSRAYLEAMGFGNQPWLAYRHNDTLHAHVHLVSTTIKPNGQRKPLSPDHFKNSRKLTHVLEQRFGLDQGNEEAVLRAQHSYLQKVEYGKVSLYPGMKLVLETIVPAYRYTNLEELNAVLGLFNIKASRGKEHSVTYQQRGLIYYPLRADGRVGDAYIKASAFPSRPTLDHLEERFGQNLVAREEHRRRLTSTIDYTLASSTVSFDAFTKEMGRQQISVVVSPLQVWYVDHRTQAVFEGSALGERYGFSAVHERCIPEETYRLKQQLQAQEEAQRQSHRMRHSL